MSASVVISHPTGNQNVRNAALALHRANALRRFYTTVAWRGESKLAAALPAKIVATLRRREYAMLPPSKVATRPWRESCRLLATAVGARALVRREAGPWCIDAVYRDLDAHVARALPAMSRLTGAYAYEDGALETFRAAKRIGVRTTYEVASGYWRAAAAIFAEEAELKPEWAVTIAALQHSRETLARKDEEIALADRVVVASAFTARNLALGEFRDKELAVIPYGAPEPADGVGVASAARTLRVLFVGGLSQGKGLSYLFDGIALVAGKVSLTVIGRRNRDCAPLDRRLKSCRYIPSLPHGEVLQEMRRHDVLVFPSLWDGFGLVILEALSQGLPVVASTNCGGPDVITDGVDGFIVPIRSAEAIGQRLESLADDAALLEQMKCAALATARRHSWQRYQATLMRYVG